MQENGRLRQQLSNLREQNQTSSQQASEMQSCLSQAQADLATALQVPHSCLYSVKATF